MVLGAPMWLSILPYDFWMSCEYRKWILKSRIEHTGGTARVMFSTAVTRAVVMVCLKWYASTRCCLSLYLLTYVLDTSSLLFLRYIYSIQQFTLFPRWLSTFLLVQIPTSLSSGVNPPQLYLCIMGHYVLEALAPQLLSQLSCIFVIIMAKLYRQ